jgi:hypothetical protein
MKEPRVKTVVKNYERGNLKKVYEYLTQPDMVVDPSTWSGQVKRLIEEEQFVTAKDLIELVGYKFKKQ